MLDILVDQPKKRLFMSLIVVGLVLELVLVSDLVFGFDVIKAPTFSELLNLQNQNAQSFYSYFFFSCLSSGVVYLKLTIGTILSYIHLIFQALSAWDWMLITAFVFLGMSHHSKQSKVTLCILSAYFIFKLLTLLGIAISLISAMNSNSANAVLSRIQISGIFLIFSQALALSGNGYWIYHLVKDCYLKLFKENDSH